MKLRVFSLFIFLFMAAGTPSMADFQGNSSGKFFVGLGGGDIDVTPFVIGADYRFEVDRVDFFRTNDLKLLGGFLYWSESEGSLDFSVLELSTGLEKTLNFNSYLFNFGGRLGFAQTKVSVDVPFLGSVSDTETNLFIAPFAELLFPINEQMGVGGEFRLPIYFGDSFDAFDIFYLLASFNYIF